MEEMMPLSSRFKDVIPCPEDFPLQPKLENEGTINWLKKSIHTRTKSLEELHKELDVLLVSIPQIERKLEKDKKELAHLENR